jgi:PAS domain S-box-containing protein
MLPDGEWPIGILIVDDDETYTASLRTALLVDTNGQHVDVAHVQRLADVLPALKKRSASVVLLNIDLPDGNALDWLRVNRPDVDATVFVLSSVGPAAAASIGTVADDFFTKSDVGLGQLARVVRYAADLHRIRTELFRTREYFRSLVRHARDLITVVDERGLIRYQSPATKPLFGQPPELFVGRSVLSLLEADQATRACALRDSVLEGQCGASKGGEFSVRLPDGSVRYVDVVASWIAPADGMRQLVLNWRDVTEWKRAQEALRLREEMLAKAQKMEAVGRLAGGIAHDFSNVLTVVTAACESLQDKLPTGSASDREIGMILRNADRAADLVRQLLAFSRQQTLTPRPIDLGRLVSAAADLLTPLVGEHIDLVIEIASGCHVVEADPSQIEQVLMNLAINARDAMPTGGRVRVRLEHASVDEQFAQQHAPQPPGEYVLLKVSDTGRGMDVKTRQHAFEPFFTTKDAVHGGGLGLSTVYGIVKQSGGYVWIDSTPGQGTVISVYLPPTAAIPVDVEATRPPARCSVEQKLVLLTEDEDDVRELIHEMLTSHGYSVLSARDPLDATTRAEEHKDVIDLLLTDVVMPGGNGRDLARRLTASRPGIKVLYMSGYPEHGAAPGSVLEPGDAFIAKPFTREMLLQRIRDVLH